MKKCKHCGKIKSRSHFRKFARGLGAWCESCREHDRRQRNGELAGSQYVMPKNVPWLVPQVMLPEGGVARHVCTKFPDDEGEHGIPTL